MIRLIINIVLFIILNNIIYSQDTTIVLNKREYTGIIKGIIYLEQKDSISNNIINQYDSIIIKYDEKIRNDSLSLYYKDKILDEFKNQNDIMYNKIYELENPKFYNTREAFYSYGVLSILSIFLILK